MKWIAALLAASFASAQAVNPDKRLEHATAALRLFLSSESNAPKEPVGKAQCIAVIPRLIKGTALIGMKYGHGYVSCRKATGGWTTPASIAVEGQQLGPSDTDVVTLVMTDAAMQKLMGDKFAIDADMTSFASTKGPWEPTSLAGATLRPDPGENKKLYGRDLTNQELLSGKVVPPRGAKGFVALLTKRARKTR